MERFPLPYAMDDCDGNHRSHCGLASRIRKLSVHLEQCTTVFDDEEYVSLSALSTLGSGVAAPDAWIHSDPHKRLDMRYKRGSDGALHGHINAGAWCEGPPSSLHGGMIGSIFAAFSAVVYDLHSQEAAAVSNITVNMRKRVPLHTPLVTTSNVDGSCVNVTLHQGDDVVADAIVGFGFTEEHSSHYDAIKAAPLSNSDIDAELQRIQPGSGWVLADNARNTGQAGVSLVQQLKQDDSVSVALGKRDMDVLPDWSRLRGALYRAPPSADALSNEQKSQYRATPIMKVHFGTETEGASGFAHNGAVAMLMDDTLGRGATVIADASMPREEPGQNVARLQLQFLRPVPIHTFCLVIVDPEFQIEGRKVTVSGRVVSVDADASGNRIEYCRAQALRIRPKLANA